MELFQQSANLLIFTTKKVLFTQNSVEMELFQRMANLFRVLPELPGKCQNCLKSSVTRKILVLMDGKILCTKTRVSPGSCMKKKEISFNTQKVFLPDEDGGNYNKLSCKCTFALFAKIS